MPDRKQQGIHIKEKIINIDEIVAVDMVDGLHRNVFHNHNGAYELMFCVDGHMVMRLRDEWIDMDAGCCMLIPPGVYHTSLTESNATHCFFIAFATRDSLTDICEHVIRLSEPELALYHSLLPELTRGYIDTSMHSHTLTLIPNEELPLGSEQLILCSLEQLLVLMLRSEHESPEKRFIRTHTEYASSIAEKNYFIENVNAYIKEHLSERLSVEDIASHFGYSRSRLSTLYKQHTGMGLNKAINMEKHLKARQLLIESDYSVSEISEMLGFSSPQYFTNAFEKSTGMSPSNYARFKRTKIN